MDTFIVSARKYRPQIFSTVVGQGHITTTLKNAIEHNQLAHAFLFCGPRGVGKTTCARILAKTINCEKKGKDGEACNKCTSCISFDNGTSFNIHELDAASNNSVDDIRTLTEQVRFAPQAGKYKVYIVDEVHMLSSAAFNAFLKTLEEPPPFVIFILATTEKHKILPTILSRCQIFDFKRITLADTVNHLKDICKKENITAEETALHLIAQKSEGCMRDALSILDKIVSFTNGKITYANTIEHLNILDEDYYFRLLENMQNQKTTETLLLFDEINQKGFEGDTLIDGMAECIRNILVSKDPKAAILLETADDFRKKYADAAKNINSGWLLAALNILSEASVNFKQSRNKRLFLELVLIKLSYLNQAVEFLSEEKGIVKKKLIDKGGALSFKTLQPIKIKEGKNIHLAVTIEEPRAKLTIETPALKKEPKPIQAIATPEPALAEAPVSIGMLSRIREKIAEKERGANAQLKELSFENMQNAWNLFIQNLEERKMHSSVTNFKNAKLDTAGENCICIKVDSDFHRKFIEAERRELINHLREYFNNRFLTFIFEISQGQEIVETERPLSAKEQYGKLAEAYPWLKMLKERLKLELDI